MYYKCKKRWATPRPAPHTYFNPFRQSCYDSTLCYTTDVHVYEPVHNMQKAHYQYVMQVCVWYYVL